MAPDAGSRGISGRIRGRGRAPLLAAVAVAAVVAVSIAAWKFPRHRKPSAPWRPPELWLYYQTNLLPRANVDALEQVWRRAASAGYAKVLLADFKFTHLDRMPREYFDHVERVKALAAELKLEIVPAVFPIGYSNSLLAVDPNLAEGLPVRDALFVVGPGGRARLQPDPPVALPIEPDSVDRTVNIEGSVATVTAHSRNARFSYDLSLPKYRNYHVAVRVKTDGYTGEPRVQVLGKGERRLQYTNLRVKATQDWTEHHVTFNTLDHDRVTLYFGVWPEGPVEGTLRWKDWQLEEAGLVNVLRRPGTPCVVRTEAGASLREGEDYKPIRDPQLDRVRDAGEYSVWHEPPDIATRGLAAGTRLRASWYHPAVIYDEQVTACVSELRTLELLADQARHMRETWGTRGYMMNHDEVRTLNWDRACRHRSLTPGQLLADNVRHCQRLLSGSDVYVWSDMFDPHHNARDDYFLVRGGFAGSWDGLDRAVTVVNWNAGARDESLEFFAGRGHRQVVAGYYDAPVADVRRWLSAANKIGGVDGVMYTTWRSDFEHLEDFAESCRKGPQEE